MKMNFYIRGNWGTANLWNCKTIKKTWKSIILMLLLHAPVGAGLASLPFNTQFCIKIYCFPLVYEFMELMVVYKIYKGFSMLSDYIPNIIYININTNLLSVQSLATKISHHNFKLIILERNNILKLLLKCC